MHLLTILFSLLVAAATPWKDANVNEISRLPMHADYDVDSPQMTVNGDWKFQWFESMGQQQKDFWRTDIDDSAWDTMPVPGMWELNGYGDPQYVNIGYCWRGHEANTPGKAPDYRNHVGQYRRSFAIPAEWKGRDIILTLGSVTSNVQVWVNGKFAGYSEDSKLQADFDITKLVKPGQDNLIALEVHRWCDGTYMEDQDFWRFSGIARESYITARPKVRVQDITVKADMDGKLSIDAQLTKGAKAVEYTVTDQDGKVLTFSTKDGKVDTTVENPKLWSAEKPCLYHLTAACSDGKAVTETVSLDFGFRTSVISGGQLLVNGKPILIKGTDRHELNAYRGYVVDEADMIKDILVMKQLNINAVRTSHYPNDPRWLRLCSKYGIYLVDEANNESHGMGYGPETLAKNPMYELTTMQRVQRMVARDKNQACVIIWSLGNEAGNGPNFVKAYDWIKSTGDQRPVQYERAIDDYFRGISKNTDIYCPMYESPEGCERYLNSNPEMPLIQCEYAHAMGNSMGNFKEYWDLIRKYPQYQGGFIWDFVDQAIVWPSKAAGTDHIFAFGGDFNDYDASDNSFNCNGVIAADRSLHPHAYEVRYQYQNIWTKPVECGKVEVFNENFFRCLKNFRLCWEVVVGEKTVLSGAFNELNAKAQKSQVVDLGFTEKDLDACKGKPVYLNIRYELKKAEGLLQAGDQVAYQQICIQEGKRSLPKAPKCQYTWSVKFDEATGALASYKLNGRELVKEPLMPCFGRAMTENDLGAGFEKKFKACLYPEFRLASFTTEGKVTTARYDAGCFKVDMVYTVAADGVISVSEHVYDVNAEVAPFFCRVGVEMAMPGQYSTLDFWGAGPWETYCDRESAAIRGQYIQRVEDQYHYGYVRPQESGTHVDLQWLKVIDESGEGLVFGSPKAFSGSALPFSRRQIDMAVTGGSRWDQDGDQRHSLELKGLACEGERSLGGTYLNVDLMQIGVGGICSWGTWPLKEYMLPAGEYTFDFVIAPVAK